MIQPSSAHILMITTCHADTSTNGEATAPSALQVAQAVCAFALFGGQVGCISRDVEAPAALFTPPPASLAISLPQDLSRPTLLAVLPTRVAALRRLNASSHPND